MNVEQESGFNAPTFPQIRGVFREEDSIATVRLAMESAVRVDHPCGELWRRFALSDGSEVENVAVTPPSARGGQLSIARLSDACHIPGTNAYLVDWITVNAKGQYGVIIEVIDSQSRRLWVYESESYFSEHYHVIDLDGVFGALWKWSPVVLEGVRPRTAVVTLFAERIALTLSVPAVTITGSLNVIVNEHAIPEWEIADYEARLSR